MKIFYYGIWLCLSAWMLTVNVIDVRPAAAAPLRFSQETRYTAAPGHIVRKKRNTPSRPAGLPTLVQDVRVMPHADHTRLVLDLQRSVTFTQNRRTKPDRVIIQLHNSLLTKAALAKLNNGDLPDEISITQADHSAPQSVLIALDLETISDYKLLPLNRPARLVVDLFNRQPREESQPVTVPPPPVAVDPISKQAPRPPHADINTIVIDAGHGGKDPGAIGRNGTAEKDITLQVSLLLRDLIEKRLGKRVLMTRDQDVFVELEDRAAFANTNKADLFVSVHVNSHPHRTTKGVEVYHFGEASDPRALAVAARENGMPIEETGTGVPAILASLLTGKKLEESLELAWTIKQAMVSHLSTHYDIIDHGVKTGPFYVLRHTAMPSILAEIAFISNSTEERLMQGKPFLTRIAEGIFEGVQAFINPPPAAPMEEQARRVKG
ncbi:MAG: N-acetylmuramoyl-L-alanine amidase [Nitrospiraceae bacterium]|nr:N-acetylmuramoyl-L-alanine amidase [Nitrospiraceae bacterium]